MAKDRAMVHTGSVPQPSTPAPTGGTNGRSSGRKRTPKSCDCCGPNCKPKAGGSRRGRAPDVEKSHRKRGRKKKPPESEQGAGSANKEVDRGTGVKDAELEVVEVTGVDVTQLADLVEMEEEQASGSEVNNVEVEQAAGLQGTGSETDQENGPAVETKPEPQSGDVTDPLSNGTFNGSEDKHPDWCSAMEVDPPTFGTWQRTNQLAIPRPDALWDHPYCKAEAWSSTPALEGDGTPAPQTQLLSAEMSHEGIRDLIHEFLECFYVKHGSFTPLSESDVLEHLNKTCNTDLNHRKLNINSEVTKYKAGLASAPMHFFKVTCNKHTLTLEDLATLEDQNWVNDQVINMYGELIMDSAHHKVHFFNSFFYRQLVAKGYEGVKRWTKKVDLFSKRLLLFPIHLEIHWSLITVDIANQTINFYDSQGIMFKYAVDNILRYLVAEAKEKKRAIYQKGWKMIVNKCIPQQKNDSDCGVFVLEYCRCLALSTPLQFSQEDMPDVRKRIYKELCACRLRV